VPLKITSAAPTAESYRSAHAMCSSTYDGTMSPDPEVPHMVLKWHLTAHHTPPRGSWFCYNAHFVKMLFSLGSHHKRYNEVAVYFHFWTLAGLHTIGLDRTKQALNQLTMKIQA